MAIALSLSIPVHARSEADCAARADRAAYYGGPTVVGGAARGAVGGAVVGGIISGRRGARRGAAAGAIVGGASRAAVNYDRHRRVYDDCMYDRY